MPGKKKKETMTGGGSSEPVPRRSLASFLNKSPLELRPKTPQPTRKQPETEKTSPNTEKKKPTLHRRFSSVFISRKSQEEFELPLKAKEKAQFLTEISEQLISIPSFPELKANQPLYAILSEFSKARFADENFTFLEACAELQGKETIMKADFDTFMSKKDPTGALLIDIAANLTGEEKRSLYGIQNAFTENEARSVVNKIVSSFFQNLINDIGMKLHKFITEEEKKLTADEIKNRDKYLKLWKKEQAQFTTKKKLE